MSINKAKSIREVISKLTYIAEKLDENESAEDFAISMMIADCVDYLRDIENPWHTGTPPKNKEGWCLIMVMVTDCDRTEFEEYEAAYWRGDYWDKRHKQSVVKWQPVDLHEKQGEEE